MHTTARHRLHSSRLPFGKLLTGAAAVTAVSLFAAPASASAQSVAVLPGGSSVLPA